MSNELNLPTLPEGLRWNIEVVLSSTDSRSYTVSLEEKKKTQRSFWAAFFPNKFPVEEFWWTYDCEYVVDVGILFNAASMFEDKARLIWNRYRREHGIALSSEEEDPYVGIY